MRLMVWDISTLGAIAPPGESITSKIPLILGLFSNSVISSKKLSLCKIAPFKSILATFAGFSLSLKLGAKIKNTISNKTNALKYFIIKSNGAKKIFTIFKIILS